MRCAGIPAYGVQMANFHQKNENDEFTIFLHFYAYLMAVERLCFCEKLANINNKNPKVLTERPLSSQAHSAILGALVYQGIPSDLRSWHEQSHHLPGALLSR